MARPVTLFTGQWADLKLEELCQKAKDFGKMVKQFKKSKGRQKF